MSKFFLRVMVESVGSSNIVWEKSLTIVVSTSSTAQ